jgi:hypothetical protein
MAEAALVVALHLAALVALAGQRGDFGALSPSTFGVPIDSTDTAMPSLSIASTVWLGFQFFSRS